MSNGVLILSWEYPPFSRSGVGTHVTVLVRSLIARGIPVYVFTYSDATNAIRTDRNVTVVTVTTDRDDLSRYRHSTLDTFYSVVNDRILTAAINYFKTNNCKPDLIHCHDFHLILAAIQLRDILRIPLISTIHLLHEPLLRWGGAKPPDIYIELEKLMCTQSDHIIAVCLGFRQLIEETYAHSHAPIDVIHNGLDLDEITRSIEGHSHCDEIKTRLNIANDKVIIFSGRFSEQKSLVEIIRSASHVYKAHREVTYLFAGYYEDTSYAKIVRDVLKQSDVPSEKLRFLGRQSRQTLFDLYLLSDIAVLPSLYEGLPYSALEAMSLGVPVIATETCGITDLIDHRQSGFLIPILSLPDNLLEEKSRRRCVDVDALAAAQLELLRDPELARHLGIAGQTRVRDEFGLYRMIELVLDVYGRAQGIAIKK